MDGEEAGMLVVKCCSTLSLAIPPCPLIHAQRGDSVITKDSHQEHLLIWKPVIKNVSWSLKQNRNQSNWGFTNIMIRIVEIVTSWALMISIST